MARTFGRRGYWVLGVTLAALMGLLTSTGAPAQETAAKPITKQTVSDAPSLQARQFAAVAHSLSENQFMVFGGTYGYQRFSDTWVWGPAGWQVLNPKMNPASRILAAAAYDSDLKQAVLFGGRVKNQKPSICSPGAGPEGLPSEFFCQDTWVWNGSTWSKKITAQSPSGREGHSMAYDAAHRQIVLFGGNSESHSGPLNDTWVWDGKSWKALNPAHKPPARFWQSMAFDPIHQQVVMFGGFNGKEALNDTWIWNGEDWRLTEPRSIAPTRRTGAGLDYDPGQKKMVLFSGSSWTSAEHGSPATDAWTWDGADWAKLSDTAFRLVSNFSELTAADRPKALIANGTPSIVWIPTE